MRGVLSGVAGRRPAAASTSSSSSMRGDDGPCVAQQLVHGPRLHGGVHAPLLHGGPDHHRAVGARHQVDGAPVHEAANRPGEQRGTGAAGGRVGRGAGCAP